MSRSVFVIRYSAQTARRIVVGGLILALLLAQGLRVCVHTHDPSAHLTSPGDAISIHLEGTFGDEEQIAATTHMDEVPLLSLFKYLFADPIIAIVSPVLLAALLVPQRVIRVAWPHLSTFQPSPGCYSSPPLRAPPR